MWRRTFAILQKVILPAAKDNLTLSKFFYSSKSRRPKTTAKITLISASVGVLIGAGYGGYTHYIVNARKAQTPIENEEFTVLKEAPPYKAHYKVSSYCVLSNRLG